MKELQERIMRILLQFKQEELGNRLSQFAMQSLIVNIESEFDREVAKQVKEQKCNDQI